MRWPPRLNRPYRPCVGIMLVNKENMVFIAQRLDHPSEAWQMPQGGIEEGEQPEIAVFRELKEEIGTNNAEILAKAKKQYKYEIPTPLSGRLWKGKYRGQIQTWFLMRYLGSEEDIILETEHPEFIAWRWATLDELVDLAIHFKREVYASIVEEFRPYLESK